jgi:hypothetical protein
MVNHTFVKENAVKKTEIAFEMAEMVRLYESDLGINHAYIVFKFVQVVFRGHFFSQLIELASMGWPKPYLTKFNPRRLNPRRKMKAAVISITITVIDCSEHPKNS